MVKLTIFRSPHSNFTRPAGPTRRPSALPQTCRPCRRPHSQHPRSHYSSLLLHLPFHRACPRDLNLLRNHRYSARYYRKPHNHCRDPRHQPTKGRELFLQLLDHSRACIQWECPIPVSTFIVYYDDMALVHTDAEGGGLASDDDSSSDVGKHVWADHEFRRHWFVFVFHPDFYMTNDSLAGLIYSVIAPLMLVFISASFAILWVAYRHNYYYVQRVKVDTHGMLFEKALSQLVAGVYVLEIALIGLFFLVRNSEDNVACTPQAIIMIVALVLTGIFHWVLEANLRPLYEFLPVSLEDDAADKERERFRGITDMPSSTGEDSAVREGKSIELSHPMSSSEQHRAGDSAELSNPSSSGSEQLVHTNGKDAISDRGIKQRPSDMQTHETTGTDAATRKAFLGLRKQIAARLANNESQTHSILPRTDISRRIEVGNQLGAAIADYPDELTDLSLQELEAELKVAYQDPITREPAPIIWIPQDAAGVSEDMIKQASKYGRLVQYSNAGAYLSKANKCEITRPAPDVRPDWLLDWVL